MLVKIILSLLICIPSYARCVTDVTKLDKGQDAPCAGFLFSPEKEVEVRIKVKTYNLIEEQLKINSDINKVLDLKIDKLTKYNSYLSERLSEEKRTDFWVNTLYFALGAVLTGAIAKNVR